VQGTIRRGFRKKLRKADSKVSLGGEVTDSVSSGIETILDSFGRETERKREMCLGKTVCGPFKKRKQPRHMEKGRFNRIMEERGERGNLCSRVYFRGLKEWGPRGKRKHSEKGSEACED